MVLPYSRKYWWELNFTVESQIAISNVLADLNMAVRYRIAICIYVSNKVRRILIWWLLRQSAKLPNLSGYTVCTIWYEKGNVVVSKQKEKIKTTTSSLKILKWILVWYLFYSLGNHDFWNLQSFLILKHYLSVKFGWSKCLQEIVLVHHFAVPFCSMQMCVQNFCHLLKFQV